MKKKEWRWGWQTTGFLASLGMAAGHHINTARLKRGSAKYVGARALDRFSSSSLLAGHFLVLFGAQLFGSGAGSVLALPSGSMILEAFARPRCEGLVGLLHCGCLTFWDGACLFGSMGGKMLRAEQPYEQLANSLTAGLQTSHNF